MVTACPDDVKVVRLSLTDLGQRSKFPGDLDLPDKGREGIQALLSYDISRRQSMFLVGIPALLPVLSLLPSALALWLSYKIQIAHSHLQTFTLDPRQLPKQQRAFQGAHPRAIHRSSDAGLANSRIDVVRCHHGGRKPQAYFTFPARTRVGE
jgi:hypothetical protein